jgi:hypothetical protein
MMCLASFRYSIPEGAERPALKLFHSSRCPAHDLGNLFNGKVGNDPQGEDFLLIGAEAIEQGRCPSPVHR